MARPELNGLRVLRPKLNGPREASSGSLLMDYCVPANLVIGSEEFRTCPFFKEYLEIVVLFNGTLSSLTVIHFYLVSSIGHLLNSNVLACMF